MDDKTWGILCVASARASPFKMNSELKPIPTVNLNTTYMPPQRILHHYMVAKGLCRAAAGRPRENAKTPFDDGTQQGLASGSERSIGEYIITYLQWPSAV